MVLKVKIAILFLILAAAFSVKYVKKGENQKLQEAGDLCKEAPSSYKEQCEKGNAWLDQKLVEWKPSGNEKINFAAYHVFASDDMFVKSNKEADLEFLRVLEETGSDIIVLYIRPSAYFSQKERYDSLIEKIRNDKKKIFIGARFDDVKMSGIEEYESRLSDYTKNIIAKIKPDYYGIVIEPTTMEKRNGFKANDGKWEEVFKNISELSKQLSSGTKTVIGGHKEELGYLRKAANIGSVDVVGFNIYDITGIYQEYSGYLGKGDVVGNAIDFANSKGKETWILETWIKDITANKEIQNLAMKDFMKPLDAKWIRVITYYAQKHNMKAVTPFFTGKFVAYTNDPKEFKSELENGKRSPAFYAYKELVSESQK